MLKKTLSTLLLVAVAMTSVNAQKKGKKAPEQPASVQPMTQIQPSVTLNDIKALVSTIQKPVNQRKLVKITAFFDDGTFQELTTL